MKLLKIALGMGVMMMAWGSHGAEPVKLKATRFLSTDKPEPAKLERKPQHRTVARIDANGKLIVECDSTLERPDLRDRR
jgi:hypothetical protein